MHRGLMVVALLVMSACAGTQEDVDREHGGVFCATIPELPDGGTTGQLWAFCRGGEPGAADLPGGPIEFYAQGCYAGGPTCLPDGGVIANHCCCVVPGNPWGCEPAAGP